MPSGLFGLAGAYTTDPGAALQRDHRERVAQHENDERAEKWVATKLVGRTFTSYQDLLTAACVEAVRHYDRALTPSEHATLSRAARTLFAGLAFRATLAPVRAIVTTEPHAVTFRAA